VEVAVRDLTTVSDPPRSIIENVVRVPAHFLCRQPILTAYRRRDDKNFISAKFETYDTDGDSLLAREELAKLLRGLNNGEEVPEEEIVRPFNRAATPLCGRAAYVLRAAAAAAASASASASAICFCCCCC
jgi:hypothetical protein